MSSNDGGSGRFSAIVAKWVGSSSARRRSKNAAISSSNPATRPWTGLDLALDHRRRAARSRSRGGPCASVIFGLGLLADPGDLGLRPLADRGDVVVGRAAEVGGLGRRAAVDLLDVGLRVGLELAQVRVPRLLGGGLHRLREVGEELARLPRARATAPAAGADSGAVVPPLGGRRRSCPGRNRPARRAPARRSRGRRRSWASRPSAVGRAGRRPDRSRPVRSLDRSELQGSRKPARASVGAMRGCASPADALGVQGVSALCRWVVGVVESARGTSRCVPVVPRWSGAGPHRRSRRGIASPRAQNLGSSTDGPVTACDRARRARRSSDLARPAAPRPADLGHGSLQLPLHLLHAEGDLRAGLRVPAAGRGPDASRRSSGSRGSSSGSASRSSGSPAASRSSGATCRSSSRCWRRSAGPTAAPLDLTLTTNGSALRKLAARARATPACDGSRSASTRSTTRSSRAMNGVDFPVAKVLDGIAAAQEAGLGPIKINMVVRRGINEASVLPMARWARDDGRDPAVHRVHGRRPHERLAARRGRRRPTSSSRRSTPRCRSSGCAAALPRRGRGALALRRTAAARSGVIASVTPAVLRRLHAGPALGRGQALHVPLHRRSATTCGRSLRDPGATDDRPARGDRRASGASATTATRELRTEATSRPAADRDVRDGRLSRALRVSREVGPRGVASACDRGLPPGSRRPVLARPQRDPALPRPDPGHGSSACSRAPVPARSSAPSPSISSPRRTPSPGSKWRFGCWSVR